MKFNKYGIIAATLVLVLIGVAFYFLYQRFNYESHNPLSKLDTLETVGAPDFKGAYLSGGEFRLYSQKGKIVLLNFWATWCAPCVEEFPSMVKLAKLMEGKLVLVTVAADENQNDVIEFIKVFGGQSEFVHHLWDPKRQIIDQFGVERLPESLILNQDMKVVKKIVNSEKWDADYVVSYLKTLLEPKGP